MRQGERVRLFVQRRVLLRARSAKDLCSINIQLPELLKDRKCGSLGRRRPFYSMPYDDQFYPDSMWTNFMSKQFKYFFFLLFFFVLLQKKEEKIQDEIKMKKKKKTTNQDNVHMNRQ